VYISFSDILVFAPFLILECSPGVKGCVLNGRYVFPVKGEEDKEKKEKKKDNTKR